MTMKIDQFLKAAKRYSANADIPLSKAQELMAQFFGHKTFHAATLALTCSSNPPGELKNVANGLPNVLVICGPSGSGKSTLVANIAADCRSRKFAFSSDPKPNGKFECEPDWKDFDIFVIDEVTSYEKQSFIDGLLRIELDCIQYGKSVLLVTQWSADFFRLNFENFLKTTPAYCELSHPGCKPTGLAEFQQTKVFQF